MTRAIAHIEPLEFQFRWLDQGGATTSFWRLTGDLNHERIRLHETLVPLNSILGTGIDEKQLGISTFDANAEGSKLTLVVELKSKAMAATLKQRIEQIRSHFVAQRHQKTLIELGEGHRFRDYHCPSCQATNILTDLPVTPQVYCAYCQTLKTVERLDEPIANEAGYRICRGCGMFAKPIKFTTFYFYFLLVTFGFSSESKYQCHGCLNRDAWKMLFGNLIFVLGVPFAVFQLARSYHGDRVAGAFRGLSKGNARASVGDVAGALKRYEAILERVPHAAGVKYNLGLALLAKGDLPHAAQVFELSLEDCANYFPAYQQIIPIYRKLGEIEKIEQLETTWRLYSKI